MKAKLLLLLILTAFSCKKKSEDESSNSIIGKWTVRSYVISNFENSGKDQDDTKGQTPRPTFEFGSNGIFTSTLETHYTQKISYKISGNQVTFDQQIAFQHKIFTFKIESKVLHLTRTDNFTVGTVSYVENTSITLDRI